MANFKDYLDYYKQTGKLPSGIDQDTMNAAVQNANILGIPSETQQIPFAPENQSPAIPANPIAGDDANVPTQSATEKAIKLAAAKPAMSAPTVSPETQAVGVGEKPAPVNPAEDKEMQAAQAQARANQEEAKSEMVRRLLFQGIAGLGSGQQINLSKDLETNLEKTANMPVEQLQAAREQQLKKMQVAEEAAKSDPNSSVSKIMRDTLHDLGVAVPANATYATMEKLAPQIMKNKEFQMRMQEMALRREELAANRENTQKSKIEDKERKGLVAVGTYRGEPDVSKLKQRLEQVSSVIANIGDVNKPWSEVEKQAVQQEINAFLKGGSPTDQDARHTYKSLEGEASQLMTKVTNDPQAFNDPKTKQRILNFVKPVYEHHKEYLDRRDARKLLAEGYNSWSDTAKNEAAYMYPDAVKMIEEKGNISPYGKGHEVSGSGMVHMMDTNGKEYDVPSDKVETAKSKGWKVK